jgi:solute carrier family 34 (sodium-dependent phosphate cotransporter)
MVRLIRFVSVASLLYLFLVSIDLMGVSFKLFGKEFSQGLIQATSNPFLALFSGLLATSLIQSSSTTTAMIVSLVGSGTLTVENAVPMVMGANIGTAVTATLTSLGHVTRKEEFRRAFTAATMHDFFNLLSVMIFFPLELMTGYLQKMATFVAGGIESLGGVKYTSPVKIIVRPLCKKIKHLVSDFTSFEDPVVAGILLTIACILLFTSLFFLVKVMRSWIVGHVEAVFDKVIFRSGVLAMAMGALFTMLVQSSSITTSMLVPMIGAGLLTAERAFPITLGANVGTTITAMLAALTGGVAGLTIALVHLFFNITGILIFYPIQFMRQIPINLARGLANLSADRKWVAVVFVLVVFFIVPLVFISLSR